MAEKLIPLEDAQSIVLSHVVPTDLIEIPVWQAAGLPLAEDAVADIDISPFANSAMDGYAVRSADLVQASGEAPVTLDVIGHEAAGHVFEGAIAPGETVRIMTGAPVPEGADAVVKYEIVEVLDGNGNEGSRVSFSAPAKVGENVRSAAEEAHAGDVVMHAGEVVAPAGAGLLASAGYASVKVHAAPRVGIISLGTELVAPSELPARGQIRDSNSSALMAEAPDAGAEPVFYGIAPDDEQVIAELVHRAVQECDFVITSGGASAGDYDYVTALVRREGEVLFDRISMRPGKAITFGLLGGKPYLGLSGNPAAAYVGFEMLARPAIRKMRGFAEGTRPVQQATLTHGVKKRQHRRFFDRATVLRDPATGPTVCCVLTKGRVSSRREMPWTLCASICLRERCYRRNAMELKISIVTCSDTRDLAQDEAGAALEELIEAQGWTVASHVVVRDDVSEIGDAIVDAADECHANVVLTCGGTGLSMRDVTPEATRAVCDRDVPGIAEAIRAYSMTKTRRAMLSRAICMQRGHTLVVNFPGSTKAARESWEAIADQLEHAAQMTAGGGHTN